MLFRSEKNYEGFLRPFNIARGVIIPPGGYGLRTYRFAYTLGQQRRAAGKWMLEKGPFYDGNRITFGALALTRMACDEPAMKLEATVSRVLDGQKTFDIYGPKLTITDQPGSSNLLKGLDLVAE